MRCQRKTITGLPYKGLDNLSYTRISLLKSAKKGRWKSFGKVSRIANTIYIGNEQCFWKEIGCVYQIFAVKIKLKSTCHGTGKAYNTVNRMNLWDVIRMYSM